MVTGTHTPFLQAPGAFSFARIDGTDGVANIRWNASARASTYVVNWGSSAGTYDQITCESAATSCVITGLTNNTPYYFTVSSTNPAGTRTVNADAIVRPIGTFSTTSSAPNDGSADLTWSAAIGATSYTVRYGTSSGNYTGTVTGVSSPYNLPGLSNGVRYYIQVSAVNAENGRFDAPEVSLIPEGPPAAPVNLTAIASPAQVSLAWNTVPGALSYKVLRGTASGSYVQIASGVTANTYVDGGAANGISYYYVVRASNSTFDSTNSNEAAARPIAPFSMTSANLVVVNSVDLSWNAASGATAYDVIYGTVSGTYTTTLSGVSSPYRVTGLSGGTTYYFRIVARNALGAGTTINSTNELSATPVGLIGAPTNVTISANPAQAVLNWDAVSGASSYIVRRGTASGTYTTLASGVSGTTYTDSTAVNGTSYFYVIQSFNGVPSVDSSEVSVRPIAAFSQTSAVPTSSTSVTLTWPAASGAATYDVRYGTATGSYTTTLASSTSPLLISGLLPDTTYYFLVVARNAVGSGTSINSANELSTRTPTSAPTGLLATATTSRIQLAWTATPGAINYEVFRGTASGTYTSIATNVASNAYTDNTAVNGTTYYYVVRASNGTDSANSNESSARAIAALTIGSATTQSANSIQVSWSASSGAAAYDLKYGTVSGTYTSTLTNVTSPYTVTSLSPNTTYYFQLVARNAIGGGATINSGNELSALTSFGAPTGLIAVGESAQNYISWTPVAGASSYHLLRGTVSGTYTSLNSSITVANYTDTTAVDGTTYFYVVRASNGTDSGNSNESSARPIASFLVSTPTAATTNSLSVAWASATGASTYDLRYGTSPGVYTNTITGVSSPRVVTGLSSNTTYYFKVVARNAIGGGATVNSTNESSAITALGAPSGVVAQAGTGQITLNWNTVSGATSYHILRGTASGAETSLTSGHTTNTYVDSTAANGTTYYYVVRANNGTDSADSAEVSGRPISTFNITSLTTTSSSSLTVTWPAATGAATYDVRYGTTAGTYGAPTAGVTSPYVITGLSPNTTYYVMIVAKNAVGSGNSINANTEASATTSFGAPTGLTATATTSQISLAWTAVPGASTYHVLRGTVSGTYTSLQTGVTTNAFNDTTAVNGTTYYYVVRASNGTDSANSNEASARPVGTFAITAPTAVTVSGMTVAWGASTGATTYDLKYGTTSGSYTTTVNNATSPHALTGLTANTTYYFMVVAKNAVGGGATLDADAEQSARTALGAPAGVVATAGSSQIALSWNTVAGASSYHILRGTVSGTYTSLVSGITGLTYTDTTAVDGTTYYYVIRSNNGVDSVNSSEVLGRPIQAFTITSATTNSASQITVAWPAVTGAATYDLRYGTTSGSYTSTLSGVTSPRAVTGLAANTTYYFMIVAKNTVGTGNSVNANAEVSATTAFGAPSGLVATATTSQIQLNWTAVPGASSYNVYRGTVSGTYASLASSGSNSYTDTTAVNGTTYFYVVRATNGVESANSNEGTARPIANFTIASAVADSNSQITLTWNAAAGAASYDVKYGTTTGTYTTTLTGQTSPLSIPSLTANTTYYFMVTAKNAVGPGNSVNATTEANAKTALGAPILSSIGTNIANRITLTASATPVAGSTFSVLRATSSGGPYTAIATGLGTATYNDNSVTPGTHYYYVLRLNNGIDSANSNEMSANPIDTFAITSVTPTSATAVTVTWPTVAGAETYRVYYGTTSGTYTADVTTASTSQSITGLTAATTYYIRVQALNDDGTQGASAYSTNEMSVTTSYGPPTGLVATATTSQVQLNWTAVSGATSYHVLRGTVSGSYTSLQTGVSTNSYTDSTANNGTTYYYVVRANNGSDSANSNESSARPIAAFTITSATQTGTTSINLVWAAASGAATYDVKYGTSTGSYTNTLTNQTSPLSVTGLTAGSVYYFMVTAKNAVGGGATVDATAEINAATPLVAPATLVATATSAQTQLTWGSVASADTYNVYRGTVSGTYASLITGLTSTSYNDSTAVNGTTYYYVVRSVKNSVESANSNEGSARPIAPFTIASAVANTATQVTLTWNAASGAASYDVKYGTATGAYTTTLSNQTSPLAIGSLTTGQTYYFMVTAKNAVGGGATLNATAEASATTSLAAPAGLTASVSPGSAALSWSPVSGATNYNIYRGTASGTHTLIGNSSGATTYTASSLTDGTTYFFVVRAFNGSESVNSNEISLRPIANFDPTMATPLSTTSIQVSWSATSGAATYDLIYGTSSGSYPTTVSNVTSPYTLTGLSSGQAYYFKLVAKNTVGVGATLESQSEVFTSTQLSAPTGLTAVANDTNILLSWTPVAGATSYVLYRGTASGALSLWATGVTANPYTHAAPTAGTTYYYAITAVKNSVESAQSSEASAQRIAPFTIASTTPNSATQVTLAWNAAAGAANYDVKYGTVSGTYTTTLTNQTSPVAIGSLSAGTTYYFMVTAKNSVGSGTTRNATAESSATTAVGAPSGVAAVPGTSQIVLNWNTVSGATSYHVLRGTVSGTYTSLQTGVAGLTYTDSTAVNGTTYYYVVRANNGSDSANSSEVSGRPIAAFSLASVVATSSTAINVTWPAATGAATYDLRYGPSSGNYTTTLTGVTSPRSVTGLTPGQTYYFTIVAKNAVGTGASVNASNELSTATATAAPASLVATATTSQIGLTWAGVGGATDYNVYRGTVSGTYTSLATGVSTNSYTDSTAVNGTSYFYVVRANNGTESANSNEATGRPIASFNITSVTPTSSTAVSVVWPAPTGAATYEVRYGTVSGTYGTTLTGATSPFSVTGLTAGQTYYFKVVAKNAIGTGATVNSTNELSAVTALNAPAGVVATATTSQIALTWGNVVGATGYNVYRSTTSGSGYSVIASNLATLNYTDSTTVNGTTYYYVVRSTNGTESANSTEVSGRPIASFSITSAVATSTTTGTITWPAVAGAATYDIRYGTTPGNYIGTLPSVTSPYSASGLGSGETYYFIVVAKNAVGSGASVNSSPEASLSTPLVAPTGLTAVPGSGQIALNWGAVSGATSYSIYRGLSTGSYTSLATGITSTNYTDSTAVNGTTYFYVVRSVKVVESVNSSEVSGRPIAAFSITSVTPTSSSAVTVIWPATTGAVTYDLRYGTVSGTYTTTLTNVTSPYSVTGLTAGQTNYYRIVARNAVGSGASVNSTNEIAAATSAVPTISAITNKTMESDGSIIVTFTIADSDNTLNCSSSMSKGSSNTTVVPTANIVFSGTAPNCSATITPTAATTGTSTITLTVTDGTTPANRSFDLTVTPCVVAAINWETQPTGMVAGNLFGTAPRLSLRKADNSLCQTDLDPVSLDVEIDNSVQQDAEITATASVVPSGGYVLFNAARMTRAGTGFTISATQGTVTSNDSNSFNVTAGASSALAWEVHPPTYDRLSVMVPNPIVRTADSCGNFTNTSSVSVTVSLQNNLSLSTLSGTLTRTTTSGSATFNNLSVNNPQNGYFLRATATGYTTANSDPFDILDITLQNTVSVFDMLPSYINHSAGGSVSYLRGMARFSNVDVDGTATWNFEIVATNPGTAASTVRVRRGSTSIGAITVPANTLVPTYYSVAITPSSINSTRSTHRLRVENGNAIVTTARVVAVQTSASRAVVPIPLISIPTTYATPYYQTSSNTYAALPNEFNSTWVWDSSKLSRVNNVEFFFAYATQTTNNACVQLFNKSTGLAIGIERCNTGTTEKVSSITTIYPGTTILDGTVVEARVRSSVSGQYARFYNIQMSVNLVNVERMLNIQRVVGGRTGLAATTNFPEHRARDRSSSFGSGLVSNELRCSARATASGSATFVLRDHNSSVSGTTSTTNITASNATFTSQSSFTTIDGGPFAGSNGEYVFAGFDRTSGTFDVNSCLWITEAEY